MLEIQPRDQLRYGYRFWLDQATALPLKSEVLAADGEVLERVMFTDIQLHAVADPDRVAAIRARKAQVQAMVGDAPPTPDARSRRWQVNDLPPGFALADYRTYPDAGDGIDHLGVGLRRTGQCDATVEWHPPLGCGEHLRTGA
jgi:sigma-E factor negative regulatory protein RseB